MLPKANCAFKIPNLNDGLELNVRLYFPRHNIKRTALISGFTVLAHPYAPLGGCYDDPIVHDVGSVFLKNGFVLCTFNFRGARGSSGSTSWTGKPELADYVSVLTFMLHLINSPDILEYIQPVQKRPLFVLGGYSYGSLITSHLPDIATVQARFDPKREAFSDREIEWRAQEITKVLLDFLQAQDEQKQNSEQPQEALNSTLLDPEMVIGGHESDATSPRNSRNSLRRSLDTVHMKQGIDRMKHRLSLKGNSDSQQEQQSPTSQQASDDHSPFSIEPLVAKLLISPLLGPISGFTTMFSHLAFERKGVSHTSEGPPKTTTQTLSEDPTLAIYGDKDVFTSARKLKRWAEEITNVPASKFSAMEIAGAGHFWHEEGALPQLLVRINDWICNILSQNRPK